MQNTEPQFGKYLKKLGDTRTRVHTGGTTLIYFYFREREYCIKLNVVPSATPLIIFHKDIGEMGLNYQTMHKTIDRPDDGYSGKKAPTGT